MKSLCQVVRADIYDILTSKLGYYCVTTSEKTDYNVKLIDKCILCEKACSELCDIFCSRGYEIYNKFLCSDFYQKILVDVEGKNGCRYKNKFDNIAKDITSTISYINFIKKLDINRKGFLDKNINKNLKDFFENRINYYDEILNKEINLINDCKLDFSKLSKEEIIKYKDIINENCIDNK